MTPEKSLRYYSGECNLRKTADLKFTGIFRAIADYAMAVFLSPKTKQQNIAFPEIHMGLLFKWDRALQILSPDARDNIEMA